METLYISVDVVNRMALWLSQQQNEDGAFVEASDYYYDRNFSVIRLHVLLAVVLCRLFKYAGCEFYQLNICSDLSYLFFLSLVTSRWKSCRPVSAISQTDVSPALC